MTRALPQARLLSGDQRCAVERARRLAPAADQDPEAVAKLLGCPSDTSTVYPYAFGSAMAQMRDLLAILDELATTSRAGRRAMTTPPHEYIPAGPVGTAPYLGYCPPEVRQEAFCAVLEGVVMGAYDRRIIAWPSRGTCMATSAKDGPGFRAAEGQGGPCR